MSLPLGAGDELATTFEVRVLDHDVFADDAVWQPHRVTTTHRFVDNSGWESRGAA